MSSCVVVGLWCLRVVRLTDGVYGSEFCLVEGLCGSGVCKIK